MSKRFLTPRQAADRLGISVTTLYDWLGRADAGLLQLGGQEASICYYQTGAKGQGRIRIEPSEVERILELMRVRPGKVAERRPLPPKTTLPGITVRLGRPNS